MANSKGKILDPSVVADIVHLHTEKQLSIREIANTLNLSHGAVWKYIKENLNKVPARPSPKLSKALRKQLEAKNKEKKPTRPPSLRKALRLAREQKSKVQLVKTRGGSVLPKTSIDVLQRAAIDAGQITEAAYAEARALEKQRKKKPGLWYEPKDQIRYITKGPISQYTDLRSHPLRGSIFRHIEQGGIIPVRFMPGKEFQLYGWLDGRDFIHGILYISVVLSEYYPQILTQYLSSSGVNQDKFNFVPAPRVAYKGTLIEGRPEFQMSKLFTLRTNYDSPETPDANEIDQTVIGFHNCPSRWICDQYLIPPRPVCGTFD